MARSGGTLLDMQQTDDTCTSAPSVIAIDGPVAAGKTTVGTLLSRKLSYRFLDTGSMYRALTWVAIERNVGLEDEESLARLVQQVRLEVLYNGGERVLAGDRDISHELRRPEVDKGVSLVARLSKVRETMVKRQREIAQSGSIVMVGRDIGTVVLPDAPLKVFLSASAEERARRRFKEMLAMGQRVQYQDVLQNLRARDELDTQRFYSPLQPADDAHIVDTNDISLEEVVVRILSLCGCTKGYGNSV